METICIKALLTHRILENETCHFASLDNMSGKFRFRGQQSPLLDTARTLGNDGAGQAPLDFAPNMLEAFIPGYSVISRFILQAFGFDIGIFVSAGFILVTFATAVRFLGRRFWSLVQDYGISSIHILEYDDMFEDILKWISKEQVGRTARTLKAKSKALGDDDEDQLDENLFTQELFHTGRMTKLPPNYEPYYGTYYFVRNWRLYVFERGRRERGARSPWDRQTEEEHVTFKTIGWKTQPIKDLLSEIKEWAAENQTLLTVIRRPAQRERARQGAWARALERPSRPVETVVLADNRKAELIADVHEYLLPTTRRWYARRGIPYRRGYLFHGPPGTGKSSLSFALAGLFGLEVYLISLLDPNLTETDLTALFNSLPRRCIVLLEDIDSAGLKRPGAPADKMIRPRRGKTSGPEEPPASNGISLSGLLNAIDGVASHEGRVLVMTTNFPERLDDALIRPGRVDMQIRFTLATKHQIREIFVRMYDNEAKESKKANGDVDGNGHIPKANEPNGNPISKLTGFGGKRAIDQETKELLKPLLTKKHTHFSKDELRDLAEQFVEEVKEDTFSPAEVQNFLIPRKDPWKAVKEVREWAAEMLETKVNKLSMAKSLAESGPETTAPVEESGEKDNDKKSGNDDDFEEINKSPTFQQFENKDETKENGSV
ncbi:P-loop containing nucleoside triphosphate hydrolase protein [Microthyrium microscopicum]|uniref:P-loop containing nucleoside triphosphate hydrolase protein n=1 Tax=Microthyrium microscopicum TaxID=703497 RepID=A0A6A6UNW8_9PEZI|nr:P-loop containing nucleoside triphosphate hydrolase protein [Microthyrium microscopicum]